MSRKNLLTVVLLVVSIAVVSAFQFSPLEQVFEPTGANSQKTYTVVNDSEDQIAIEFSVLQRNQDASGEEIRSASSAEFVISPAKVIVAPSSTYVVRVKYIGPSTVTVEKAYRLVAKQMAYSLGKSQTTQSMFNFLYIYYSSLYVTPSEKVVRVEISSAKARLDEEGKQVMDVTVRNRGNVHQILLDAKLALKDSSGKTAVVSESEALGGIDSLNILARKSVTKTIPWPEGLAFVDGGTYTGSIEYSE